MEHPRNKAFEIMHRAYQLGGDLAHAGIVSFLSQADVENLQKEIDDVWDSPVKPRLFGIECVRAWHSGDRSSLTAWLTAGQTMAAGAVE